MTALRLTLAGKPLALGARLGRGGEGEIYAVADGSGRAVKLYLQPDTAREAKIGAMTGSHAAAACPDVTFPQDIVRHADGRFAGFIMAQVADHQPIHELIGASSRRRFFPHADWRFLVRVALNFARVMASIHAAGFVVGDINSAGVLVSQRGTVKLIDADSFQVGVHRCRVGMPEYTPSELQGVSLSDVYRTVNHDAFGMAVMMFQLLMLGRHPFSGVSRGRQVALDRAIREGRFAFSQIADVGIRPPPRSLLLGDLPRAIRHLFERAFLLSSTVRPSATEWVDALSDLETGLIACPVRADHVIALVSTMCPWCRIERETGRPMFIPQKFAPALVTDSLSDRLQADVAMLVRQAKRLAGEGIEPAWYERRHKPSKAATNLVGSTQGTDAAKLIERRQNAIIEAERALMRWRAHIGVWDVSRLSEEVKGSIAKFERFHARQPYLLRIAATQSVEAQVNGLLEGQSLRGSRVAGVGDALIATLARHGITSAVHLTRDRLGAITGVGEKRIVALLFWRDGLAVKAERKVRRSAQRLEAAKITARDKVDGQRAMLERSVRRGIDNLRSAVEGLQAQASQTDEALAGALRNRDQAISGLALLAGTSSQVLSPGTRSNQISAKAATKGRKAKKNAGKMKHGKTCPCCGSSMVKRWGQATTGPSTYYGCTAYPKCSGVRAVPIKVGRP